LVTPVRYSSTPFSAMNWVILEFFASIYRRFAILHDSVALAQQIATR
jgi:hypothetical protein